MDLIKILGTRGSIPVCGADYARYGGATTCVLAYLGGQYLVLDAGSGLLNLPEEAMEQAALPLLLTHPHVDHLLGLPMCPYVMRKGARLDIYSRLRGSLSPREQAERLVSPPLWPVEPDSFLAELRFHELPETMRLGAVRVDTMEGEHPGGVSVLRLEADGKRVVFATDCTVTDELRPRLAEFARGCELLLLDGQYTEEEWPARSAYGHSTWRMAAELAEACGAMRLRIIHHDPWRTDAALTSLDGTLRTENPAFCFAREGETVEL